MSFFHFETSDVVCINNSGPVSLSVCVQCLHLRSDTRPGQSSLTSKMATTAAMTALATDQSVTGQSDREVTRSMDGL